jgi:hypothetical protein
MKKILRTIDEYIPEFFIFTPIILWVAAYFTNNPTLISYFEEFYWWMFLGIALSEFDIIYSKTKNFL